MADGHAPVTAGYFKEIVMEDTKPKQAGVSKKQAAIATALGTIAASGDFRTQVVLGVIATVYIVVQGLIDWRRLELDAAETKNIPSP